MLNDIDVIKKIAAFIDGHVASERDPDKGNIGLEKPRDDNKANIDFTLVKPAVFEGWVPPMAYLDDTGIYDIPGIIVMSDGGSDVDGEAACKIRLVFATYDIGKTTMQAGKLVTTPDSKGYYDLMNLITLTRMKLADLDLIRGKLSTNNDFQWNMYDEQKYPYWHGWMTFSCPIVSVNNYMNI